MLDEMRMRTACFAHASQRCTSRLSKHFLLTFQEVTPLRKTRNQLLEYNRLCSSTTCSVREESPMAGPGSGGNVLAALYIFFIPGLGQLLQGRLGMAIVHF